MPSIDVLSAVRRSLETIADSLDEVSFLIPGPDRDAAETRRQSVIDTIRKYLLHRLREPDAPVVAALVGLSGVGKSTVLNSLAQEAISPTGVVRPTTTRGVLWAHRQHAARYWTEFVGRVTDQIGPTTDVVIGDDPLTRHLTFVDTPPLEMTPQGAATTAAETLMFADICLFVSSADRYGDVAPLEFLTAARARGIPILFVLNRLPADAELRRDLLEDFAQKLTSAGLLLEPDPGFIFGIEEGTRVRRHGGLRPEAVAALRKELSEVSDPDFRLVIIDESAEATVLAVAERAEALALALRAEGAERDALRAITRENYERKAAEIRDGLYAGDYAQLARYGLWAQAALDFAGSITRAAGEAAEAAGARWISYNSDMSAFAPNAYLASRAWIARSDGAGLVDPGHEGLRRHSPNAAETNRSALEAWKISLLDMAGRNRRRRRGKRKTQRMVRNLWKSVLDPGFVSRYWKADHATTVDMARGLLAEAASRGLDADSERFAQRLLAEIDDGVADGIDGAAKYLLDIPAEDDAEWPAGSSSHGR